MPPAPMLRRNTSAPITTVMNRRSRPAVTTMPSSRCPYHRDRVSIVAPAFMGLFGLREEFLELRSGRGALADYAVPAGLIGLRQIPIRHRAFEFDRLYAGCGLSLGFLLALFGEQRDSFGFAALGRLAQHIFLRIVQPVPRILVDEHRDFGGVESGIDAVFGFLVPSEVEYAGDRPAVAVHHAAFKRRIDLAGRRLHDGPAQRLEEIPINRGDAKL